MLDVIRNKAQSFGIKIIFGIIVLVFVFWGVGNMGGAPSGALAVVNGASISLQDFNLLFRSQLDEAKKAAPDMMSNPETFNAFKRQVLAQLILSRLRQQAAERIGLTVTPHELKLIFSGIQAFQDESGKFDPVRYKRLVASQGVSEGEFEAEYSRRLLEEKLLRSVGASVDVSEAEAKSMYVFSLEKRKAEYVLFNASDYRGKAVVSDEEIFQFYENNKESFRTAAMASLEFLRLTPETLASGYPVTDQEVLEYYEKQKPRFFQPESFRSRHIFLSCPPDGVDAPGADEKREQVRAAIEDIARQLATGADFAALAKEKSEDRQSAAEGGALGWLNKGQTGMGFETFDEAAFSLKPGETSKPVRTQAGYHIVKLEEKKAAFTRTLEEVKAEIVAELGKQKADEDFANVEKVAEDGLTMGTPLAELGKKFHVDVKATGLIAQAAAEAAVAPHQDSRRILSETIHGHASIPVGTDGAAPAAATIPVPLMLTDGIAIVRILEAKPSEVPPLDAVRGDVVDRITTNKALALARAAAEEALPQFTGKSAPAAYKNKVKESGPVARVFPEVPPLGQMRELADQLFVSSGDWLPTAFAHPEGAVIARLKVTEPVQDAEWEQAKGIFMPQLRQARNQEAVEAFMQNLVQTAKIEEYPERLDQLSLR